MARIRTIKPEFFTSEDVVELSPLARIFFIALWCEADRDGRLAWKLKTLKFRYLPGDDCNIDELSKELTDSGLIVLYEVDGKQYAEIPSFSKHQVINNKEKTSEIPSRDREKVTRDDAYKTRESGVQGERKGKEGKGIYTFPDGNDAGASEQDLKNECWKFGTEYLTPFTTNDKARTMIGKWLKSHKHETVLNAMRTAQVSATQDPIPYIEKTLKNSERMSDEEIEKIFGAAK